MINVTQPFLPSFEEYGKYLKGIWDRQWLTNNGPLVQQLEEELKNYLGVKHLLYVNNGTIALQIAIKALGLTGEIITTPFSYVATTNSILWEGCIPVFADIQEGDLNMDPEKISPLVTANTTGILATHVYGNPCEVHRIEQIAKEHGLKVIYDGAHAFGARYNGQHVLSFGDVATCSFHATKIFHTVEGGAIITNDETLAEKMKLYRSFGHVGDDHFSIGINGKNSEFHAAMGLCLLPRMEEFIANRKASVELYNTQLEGLPLQNPVGIAGTSYNYSYYPVIIETEAKLLDIKSLLEKHQINTRRYFYPSLNKLPQYAGEVCPVSEDRSKRILALPIFSSIGKNQISDICDLIRTCF